MEPTHYFANGQIKHLSCLSLQTVPQGNQIVDKQFLFIGRSQKIHLEKTARLYVCPAGSVVHCLGSVLFLPKQVNPVSEQVSRSNCHFFKKFSGRTCSPHKTAINKFQNEGNSTGQNVQFL